MTISSARVIAQISAEETSDTADWSATFSPSVRKVLELTDGTGANQCDLLYAAERTVGDGSNDDIDLYGALSDAFGATINFAELVAILIINEPRSGTANTTDLTIGDAGAPDVSFLGGTNPTIGPLKPGAMFLLAAGDAAGLGTVTDSTADELRVANSAGAAATYQIAILGRSA